MILDGIVSPAIKLLSNHFPLVSVDFMGFKDFPFLVDRPFFFIDFWVEMIYPPE